MSLTEDEKYAIIANVPYQIHEGVPIDVIEQELKLYGLDHQIDRELSDRVGVILHNDDEMIHAVRGTDFTSTRDLISDLGLMLGNPLFVKGAKTLALAESVPYALHSKYIGNYNYLSGMEDKRKYIEDVRPIGYGRLFAKKSAFPKRASLLTQEAMSAYGKDQKAILESYMALEEAYGGVENWYETDPNTALEFLNEVKDLKENIPLAKKIEEELIKKKVIGTGKAVAGAVGLVEGLAKAGGSLPEYLRIEPERERLQKALEKHPNKTPSLTGHSLGSVVNVLGREKNIKTISFNPAPQGGDDFKGHHPDSKVYRIKGDIVSFKGFRTPEDTEPITEFEPRYGSSFLDYHRVNQFIPEKPKISIERVLYSPFNYRPVKYDNKRVSQVFDYCKEYPYLTECSGRREKEYY
jgi:hypothetical protein